MSFLTNPLSRGYQYALLFAFSEAICAAGLAVGTSSSLLIGLTSYGLLGWIAPFLYFLLQTKGYGIKQGKKRAAVHLVLWPSYVLLMTGAAWAMEDSLSAAWASHRIGIAAGAMLLFAAGLWLVLEGDNRLSALYEKLAHRKQFRRWLGLVFFTGTIPAAALIAIMAAYHFQPAFPDVYTGMFLFMQLLSLVFYTKILLGMAAFGIYYFRSFSGRFAVRLMETVCAAIVWLIALYIPVLSSAMISSAGTWRMYLDPSYLSICPVLSDLWLTGFALLVADALTGWVFGDRTE